MSTVILHKPDASWGIFSRLLEPLLSTSTASTYAAVETKNVPVEFVVYRVPNAESLAALEEVANNEVVTFGSWNDFFADLYDDDGC